MEIFGWVVFVLTVLAAVPALFYWLAWLVTREEPVKRRALLFGRWTALIVLLALNVLIFKGVFEVLVELF